MSTVVSADGRVVGSTNPFRTAVGDYSAENKRANRLLRME